MLLYFNEGHKEIDLRFGWGLYFKELQKVNGLVLGCDVVRLLLGGVVLGGDLGGGPHGLPGPQAPQGLQGADGLPGPQAPQGLQGLMVCGASGSSGLQGADVCWGLRLLRGFRGLMVSRGLRLLLEGGGLPGGGDQGGHLMVLSAGA